MSDVICPYCGTPNAPDAVSCRSCNKPLFAKPPGKSGPLKNEDLDWLASFRSGDSEPPQPTGPDEDERNKEGNDLEDAEVPEWLERIRRRTMEDRLLHEMQTKRLGPEPLRQPPEPEPEAGPGPSGQGSEAISPIEPEDNLGRDQTEPEQAEPVYPSGETEKALPADMTGGKPTSADQTESGDATDWLEQILKGQPGEETDLPIPLDLAGEGDGEADAEASMDFEPAPEFLEGSGLDEFKTEFPDWPEETPFESEGEVFLDESAEERPGLIPTDESRPEEAVSRGYGFRDAAEVAEEEPEKIQDSSRDQKSKREPELVEARLPGWLEAIKPIESVVPEHFSAEADNQTESSGPLAGFQGVIPAGEVVSRYGNPASHSLNLQVSEKQRVYAGLLDHLIAEEARPVEREAVKASAHSAALRFIVGLVLVGLLAFILVNETRFGPLPGLYPIETVAFYDSVRQLGQLQQQPARILVAADYEPALSGELQTVAVSPLQQLLESGSQITIISTVPSGPALGQQLVAAASAEIANFQPDVQVINLGYLVGGNASLASLALQPSVSMSARLDGSYAWDSPLLAGIQSVSDFDGLLLLTDNPETARAWVEQVQIHLGGKPFLVISSAQAAPMILPYYQSHQIQGLLAGLSGSAVYEQLSQRSSSLTRTYWDAYQAGILLMIAAFLFGGMYYGIRAVFQTQRTGKRT